MDLVIIHIFLLFINLKDCQIEFDFRRFWCITLAQEIFQVSKVTAYKTEFFANGLPDLPGGSLLSFGKREIYLPGNSPICPGTLQMVVPAESEDDILELGS
jgi:hypothetical protein